MSLPLKNRLPIISPMTLVLFFAVALAAFYNFSVWEATLKMVPPNSLYDKVFYVSFFVLQVAAFVLLFTLVSFKPILKVVLIFVALTAAAVAYFMDTYGTAIDKVMIQNTFETNPNEVKDLLSWQMLAYLFVLGLLPSILIWWWPVKYPTFIKGLFIKLGIIAISALVAGGIMMTFYTTYSPLFREEGKFTHFINPTNYLYAVGKFVKSKLVTKEELVVKPIGTDAKASEELARRPKPSLVVLVVGETARADHFSLNGYERETNPRLKQEDIINFTDVTSCGTSTAVSVPCMFSHFPREDYSDNKGKTNEGLLDVLQRAGIQILWRENNSDCKGTCLRVPTEEMIPDPTNPFCANNDDHCVDEFVLDKLQAYIDGLKGNAVVVLHSIGSHGPKYYARYTEAFKKFTPVCETNQLGSCSRESLINVYDNTILYTDHFLAEVIALLKKNDTRFDAAMLYVSDHGESLGENGIYLHAAPYAFAPEAQVKVPMVAWFSTDAMKNWGLSRTCLDSKTKDPFSHDHFFHTVLGLFSVQTSVYEPPLDMLRSCRTAVAVETPSTQAVPSTQVTPLSQTAP